MNIKAIKKESFGQIVDYKPSIVAKWQHLVMVFITYAKRSKFAWMEHLRTVQSIAINFYHHIPLMF